MKRQMIVKCLFVAAIVLTVVGAWADVIRPSPRALTHAEWTKAMRQDSILLRLTIPCSFLETFLVVLVVAARRKRPSYLVWFVCCAPAVLLVPVFRNALWGNLAFFSVFGVSAASWLLSFLLYLSVRKHVKGMCALLAVPIVFFVWIWLWCYLEVGDMFDVSVETKAGETYEESLKRANRIIHHHCERCDKPMKDYWHDYWRCPDCNKGEMTCSICDTPKEQEPMGPYWQYGFKWICPNCDKEHREEIKRQVEEMRNGK